MAKRVDVSRLTPRQKYYLAGFRRGLTQAMSEARTLFREQLHETFRELEQLRTAYSELAERHHRAMRDRAVEEAQTERATRPGMLLH